MIDASPVVFSFTEWQQSFPELSFVTSMQAAMYFGLACLRVDNGPDAEIVDVDQRKMVLYLLVAHIALLMKQAVSVDQATDENGNPIAGSSPTVSTGMTGRLSRAEEGSVSIETEALTTDSSSALERWLNTTQYGALVWQILAPMFGPQYFPGPSRIGYQLP